MNTFIKMTAAICLATSLSGCVIVAGDHGWDNDDWRKHQKRNNQQISQLELQSERALVLEKMGKPDFTEAFVKNNDEYRVLYYRTKHERSDGETTKDETTPLIFKNNKLVGWGDQVLASIHQ